jgi:transcriptional regulator with XRE-family HTH domain
MLTLTPFNLRVMKKTEAPNSLGDRIRASRKAAKLTQEQLGAIAGVSGAAVAQWESGDSKTLKPENLFKIARRLGKSAEWLVTGEGTELPPELIYNGLSDLPLENAKQSLDYMQYQIEKAGNLIASEKAARYVTMIQAFKDDMEKRQKKQ